MRPEATTAAVLAVTAAAASAAEVTVGWLFLPHDAQAGPPWPPPGAAAFPMDAKEKLREMKAH